MVKTPKMEFRKSFKDCTKG